MPSFPYFGEGLGLRDPHLEDFLSCPDAARPRWVEVVTENYLPWRAGEHPEAWRDLLAVRREVPVALHGVSLSVAAAEPLDEEFLARLRELERAVEPWVVSDHLCWTGLGARGTHDLLPFPYTEEALELIAPKVARVQEVLRRPILLENVSSYVAFEASAMSEAEFLAALARRTGCGILLDVNNVYVNQRNLGVDPAAYFAALPVGAIGQIHVAGHADRGDVCVDTHGEAIRPEVWSLLEAALRRFGPCNAMVERDVDLPPWAELMAEVRGIGRRLRDGVALRDRPPVHEAPAP